MSEKCNHVFTIRGDRYICDKCGDVFKLGDFVNDTTEFQECPGGRCAVI